MSQHAVRLVLVDDHAIFREALHDLIDLGYSGRLRVVAEAADGQMAIEAARSLSPDVVLMDVQMPGISGFEAVRRVRRIAPLTRVMVVSAHGDEQHLQAAIRAGAAGYVLKTSPLDFLVNAVFRVMAGEWVIDPVLNGQWRNPEIHAASPVIAAYPADEQRPFMPLSPREREILALLARGMRNPQIAAALCISARTVQVHLINMYRKLRVKSRQAAVLIGLRYGLLKLDTHPSRPALTEPLPPEEARSTIVPARERNLNE